MNAEQNENEVAIPKKPDVPKPKQLVNKDEKLPTIGQCAVCQIAEGFFRDKEGRIYFAHRHSKGTRIHVVRDDKKVSERMALAYTPLQGERVDFIDSRVVGIDKIVWVKC